jgi:hypothetical protein
MNKPQTSPNKPWYSRAAWIIVVVLLIIVVCVCGWRFYKDNNPQSYVNFIQYEPSNIVDGLQVDNKTLEVWSSNIFTSLSPYSVSIVLNLDHQDSYVAETKYKDDPFDSMCDGANVVCTDKTSPQSQAYKLVLVYDVADATKRQLRSEEVVFNKSGTRIQVNVESKDGTPITEKAWGDMVDSFAPTTFNGLHVRHMQPGP